jgi:DNA adenine methylase
MKRLITTPLRYPGGKSKSIGAIAQHLPHQIKEFREPFVGGGSMALYVRQAYPDCKVWINDANTDLYCFWKCAKEVSQELSKGIKKLKTKYVSNGSELYLYLKNQNANSLSLLDRAISFFVMNRITYSGTNASGGYSHQAFLDSFTDSSIVRVEAVASLLVDVDVTNADYATCFDAPLKDTFIFCDPPYISASNSKLYGNNGNLHTGFNHSKLARDLKVLTECPCSCEWLVTYDDCQLIRNSFNWAEIIDWQVQYSMNNQAKSRISKEKELFIKKKKEF